MRPNNSLKSWHTPYDTIYDVTFLHRAKYEMIYNERVFQVLEKMEKKTEEGNKFARACLPAL